MEQQLFSGEIWAIAIAFFSCPALFSFHPTKARRSAIGAHTYPSCFFICPCVFSAFFPQSSRLIP
ncbi:MAG: hypothetical protein J3R72DRAFT_430098 [Linnemannia gamsii]|nr:MAG: hypothetical protein J3R72DRAFT_430098 [Linnemannia gamsii]